MRAYLDGGRNRVRGDFQLSFMLYAFLRGTLSSLISRKLIDGPAWNETHCSQRCVLLLSCMGITCFVNSEILFGRVPRSTRLLRTTSLGSVSVRTFFFFFFFLFFFRDAYDSDCDPDVELKIGTVFFPPLLLIIYFWIEIFLLFWVSFCGKIHLIRKFSGIRGGSWRFVEVEIINWKYGVILFVLNIFERIKSKMRYFFQFFNGILSMSFFL